MRIRFLYVVFLSFLLYSCSFDAEYNYDRYSPIPDSLRLFFPDHGSKERQMLAWKKTCVTRSFSGNSDQRDLTDLPVENTFNSFPTLIKVYRIKHSNKELTALKKCYADLAAYKMTAANAIPMLWEFDEVLDADETSKLTLDSIYANADEKFLVPNFKEEFDWQDKWFGGTLCGLSEDFELYVLKTGPECVLPNKWCVYRSWFPGRLQHGYRSGVAINDSYIIYWCIAW